MHDIPHDAQVLILPLTPLSLSSEVIAPTTKI